MMRYLTLALLGLGGCYLSGCGTVTLGGVELTPAERCIAYTGAAARYERILMEEGELNSAQQLAYDIAIAGQGATCLPPEA